MTVHVYGIDYLLPKEPAASKIPGYDLEKKKQKFYRAAIPAFFNSLEFDSDRDPIYTPQQIAYIEQELDRIRDGYWFLNYGIATYITGLHYFYLTYWTLENGEIPDYRDADRDYLYFQDYCERQPHIDGILRSKKRREGATSQATCDLVKTAITEMKAFCGIVSKTGADAKDAFLKMVRPGFFGLPVFLKPRVEDEESKTELSFNRPKKRVKSQTKGKGQIYETSMGLGSKIDFKPTQLNSYDSGRLRKLLKDESGKDPTEVPINEYWPIVRQTLKQGARKVGFALLPSTSNKLSKGGKGFKMLWDESNHFRNKTTATGLYRYFSPAYFGYAPFIDEYGHSIVEQPTREQAKWMKDYYGASDEQTKMGAKEWILHERSLIADDNARREHMRMYPLTEKDAFDYEDRQNIYNQEILANQKERILELRPVIRRVVFFRGEDGKVHWRDDPSGFWYILRFPSEAEANAFYEKAGKRKPANWMKFVLTADPFKNTNTVGPGSKGAGMIWVKNNPLDPENTCMPIAMYWGRPRLTREFHRDMLLCAEYYGAEVCFENDLSAYLETFEEENRMGYLKERPKSVIDPNRKTRGNPLNKQFGVNSGDAFAYNTMIDRSIAWVEFHGHKLWFLPAVEQLEEYDYENRTEADLAVVVQLGAVAVTDMVQEKKKDELRKIPIVKTYQIKVPA